MASSSALAQCAAARVFGGGGGGMTATKISIAFTPNGFDGTAPVGLFWEDGNAANNSNAGVTCPESEYWAVGVTGLGQINGAMSTPTCQMGMCPASGAVMNHLLEFPSLDGKYGGYVFYQVLETPAAFRWWDHVNTSGGLDATHSVVRYPDVTVTGSSGPPPNTTLTNDYADLALGYHGWIGAPVPANTGVQSYDIVAHQGNVRPNPTRDAFSLGEIANVPYNNASVSGSLLQVPCPDQGLDTWVAVCATFADGVKSQFCGQPTAVESDEAAADLPKPKFQRSIQHKKPVGRTSR
jgi:hypothetical protein